MNEIAIPVLAVFFVLLFAFGIALTIWHFSRAKNVLEQWASQNGYTILSRQRKTFLRGPYFFTTSKGQEVYYITVQDAAGNSRSGYFKVGGFFMGMMSDNVDVTWDN